MGAKKAAEAAEVALTGTGAGDGEGVMDEKLNTLISNQANMEMVQGGLVNTVNTLSLALSRMEGNQANMEIFLETINTTVETTSCIANYCGQIESLQSGDSARLRIDADVFL